MEPIVGGLLSAGLSALGGLFGQSSAKKRAHEEFRALAEYNNQQIRLTDKMNAELRRRADAAALVPVVTTTEYGRRDETGGYADMEGFMSAAAKGGFNPLTFLRSGALSLFHRTWSQSSGRDVVTTTGERAMDAALAGGLMPNLVPTVSSSAPAQNMGQILTGAAQAGFDYYSQQVDQLRQNALSERLAAIQSQRFAGAGRAITSSGGRTVVRTGAALSLSHAVKPEPKAKASGTDIEALFVPFYDNSQPKDGFGNYPLVYVPNPKIADSEQLTVAIGASGLSRYNKADRGNALFVNELLSGSAGGRTYRVPGRPSGGSGFRLGAAR